MLYEKRPSPRHSWGIFATTFIGKGTIVTDFSADAVLTPQQVTDDMYVLQVDEALYLGGARVGDEDIHPDNFINHSCDPNLGFYHGSLQLCALRDIYPDEELTWDYSTSMDEVGWQIVCRCGAANCRGQIGAFRSLDPSQQRKLLPISLAYIQKKYTADAVTATTEG